MRADKTSSFMSHQHDTRRDVSFSFVMSFVDHGSVTHVFFLIDDFCDVTKMRLIYS